MKKFLFGFLIIGLVINSYAQEEVVKLKEVALKAVNYKYLDDVKYENAPFSMEMLQEKVASYDLKDSDVYSDVYDTYEISFHIPNGYILAAYDKDGKLLRTVEKFKDVTLPTAVTNSVSKKYPGWVFKKDAYLVNYYDDKDVVKKFKITLLKGNDRKRITIDENGVFM